MGYSFIFVTRNISEFAIFSVEKRDGERIERIFRFANKSQTSADSRFAFEFPKTVDVII